ncbi:OsmC family protein [Azonexus hydrophilus]|jgi:putative redox protein|uniref:OsmC family protein n=1 Tax=Azonexus hydrophilus TaxID=418702 RepID=UPI001F050A26|nr:OsmC family protein [Azonexus hydrophilus]
MMPAGSFMERIMSSTVTVKENGQGRYQQEIRAGKHQYLADEPVDMGGADAGPAPFDFIMSGLGACTSMTLRMYAERKELPLRQVTVELSHHKVEIDGVKRDCIQRSITLDGDLTAEQRQRLLEIANKCPVHRALSQSFLLDCSLTP